MLSNKSLSSLVSAAEIESVSQDLFPELGELESTPKFDSPIDSVETHINTHESQSLNKRKHGSVWKKTSEKMPKKNRQNLENSNTIENILYIKAEPLSDSSVSPMQYTLIKMTLKDHMDIVEEINKKFPEATCHELSCRLNRYYQTTDLKDALTWPYDSATAEYNLKELRAKFQPYSSLIKQEVEEKQRYQISQDKTTRPYDSSSFPFTHASTLLIENKSHSFDEKEIILLDADSGANRSSNNFWDLKSSLSSAIAKDPLQVNIFFGTLYLYFSAANALEAKNAGSHTIVFFGHTLHDKEEIFFIDPQENESSTELEKLVNFRSNLQKKCKGDVFGDTVFYSIWGNYRVERKLFISKKENIDNYNKNLSIKKLKKENLLARACLADNYL